MFRIYLMKYRKIIFSLVILLQFIVADLMSNNHLKNEFFSFAIGASFMYFLIAVSEEVKKIKQLKIMRAEENYKI
jgi:hypothetical protein